jgi:dTDP-glucose 4,6-dehydratase
MRLKLLVTGGAGFIGSNYIRRICDGTLTGVDSVVVLDKLTYAGTLKNLASVSSESFEFVLGDICDETLVRKLAKNTDAIVNFAAESHVDRSINGSREFVETNILGVHNLLEAVKENQTQTFIQISTDEVYGSISNGSWTESEPLLPNSPYAATKASADLLCRSYFKTFGLDIRITRSSNNYGPFQFPEKIVPRFITSLIDNLQIPVYGNGFNVRDWLHVDDNCRGIHSALQSGTAGEIYNFGGGAELSNLELTYKILEFMKKDHSMISFIQDRPGHDFRYSVNSDKALKELNFKPQVSFEKGLEEVIEWYNQNQTWWRELKFNSKI